MKLQQAGLTDNGVMIAPFDARFEIDHGAFDQACIVATYDFINDVSTRSDSAPVLEALDLPFSTVFIDHDDGTGHLELFGSEQNPSVVRFGLVVDVGYFADTTYLLVEMHITSGRSIAAAPNPFANSVRILVAPRCGRLISISIFNAVGEKVWEKVNSFDPSADVINTWNGRNREGRVVAAGVYLVYVKTDQHTPMLKVLKTD